MKSVTAFTFSLCIFHEVMGPDAMILVFWVLNFKPAFSLSSFILMKRLLSSSSFSVAGVVPSAFLRLLIFQWEILIPACDLSSPAFCMHFVYKLNMQDDHIQPCYNPFPILNPSAVPFKGLTLASWTACWFFRRQVRWSGTPISLIISYSFLWSTQYSQWRTNLCFSATPLLSLWCNECWKFDLWFLCLF